MEACCDEHMSMDEFCPDELDGSGWMTRKFIQYGYPIVQRYARSTAPDPAFPNDGREQALMTNMARLLGGADSTELSKGGRPVGAKTGQNKDKDGGVGHLQALSKEDNEYLTNLFYKDLKASGGIHYLYQHMRAAGGTIPWRKVRAWHQAQIVNQKSRPANKETKSLAVMPKKSDLVPMRHIGCDSIVMQAKQGFDRDMRDRNHAGILNIIDYATRRSFPFALKKVGDR